MKSITMYVLRDGSQHDSFEKALNHCDEMMGAEMRGFVDQLNPVRGFLFKTMMDIVSEKKYDKEIREYVAWRDEHDELLKAQKEDE